MVVVTTHEGRRAAPRGWLPAALASLALLTSCDACAGSDESAGAPHAPAVPAPPTEAQPTTPAEAPKAGATNVRIVGAQDFELRVRTFLFDFAASKLTVIRSNGEVSHIFPRGREGAVIPALDPIWSQTDFELTPAELRELQQLLQDGDFFGLEDEYIHPGIADGARSTYRLKAGDHRHEVHCANSFPGTIEKMHTFVRERVLAPHEDALASATEVPSETLQSMWSAGW